MIADEIGRTVALVGASLGGMASLVAAGQAPRVDCSALVLVDVTPRMDPEGSAKIGDFMRSAPNGFTRSTRPPTQWPSSSRTARGPPIRADWPRTSASAKTAGTTGTGTQGS